MNYPLGIDISSWQLEADTTDKFRFYLAASLDVKFYIKRTMLAGQPDRRWKEYEETNQGTLLDLGRYHAVNIFASNKNIDYQINAFLKETATATPRRVWIDLEIKPAELNPHAAALNLHKFLITYKKATGITPGIYTRANFFFDHVEYLNEFRQYPLWIARYPWIEKPLVNPPRPIELQWVLGYPGSEYSKFFEQQLTLWQYSEKGPGKGLGAQSYQIDLNLFNGSEEELIEFAKQSGPQGPPSTETDPKPEPKPEPKPDPGGDVFEVIVPKLNVRTGPGPQYRIKRQIQEGDTVPLRGFGGKSCWIQIGESEWVAFSYEGKQYLRFKRD